MAATLDCLEIIGLRRLNTAQARAAALRDTIGVFGMLGVTAICILPFLQTGITYLTFKLTAGIAGLFDRKQLSALTNSLASAAGFLTAMTGSCAFMLFICFVSYIKVVTI